MISEGCVEQIAEERVSGGNIMQKRIAVHEGVLKYSDWGTYLIDDESLSEIFRQFTDYKVKITIEVIE